jgi:hypothetical protein
MSDTTVSIIVLGTLCTIQVVAIVSYAIWLVREICLLRKHRVDPRIRADVLGGAL